MRGVCFTFLAAVLVALAEEHSTTPVPTWPGEEQATNNYKGQYVFLTPDRDALVIVLPSAENGSKQIVHVALHRQSRPVPNVSITTGSDTLRYNYRVANEPSAKDPIRVWSIIVPPGESQLKMNCSGDSLAAGWVGASARAVFARQSELPPSTPVGRYATWLTDQDVGKIRPGKSIEGFEIQSTFRPGFTTAFFSIGEPLNLPQDWPDEVFKQLAFLDDRSERERTVLTIGPMFSQSATVQAVIDNFQAGIRKSISNGTLDRNSPFVSELTEVLQTGKDLHGQPMRNHPQTAFERQIAQAAQITLGLLSTTE